MGRCGEELAAVGIVPSIGNVGDSCDNAMAGSTIGLVKTELVHNPARSPWSHLSSFEFALAEYVEWFDNARLHGELDHRTPAEIEADYCRHHTPAPMARIHS